VFPWPAFTPASNSADTSLSGVNPSLLHFRRAGCPAERGHIISSGGLESGLYTYNITGSGKFVALKYFKYQIIFNFALKEYKICEL
jgi:hypothetical protein